MKIFGIAGFLIAWIMAGAATAQAPTVPANMDFAGMRLHIREPARREIQADVAALRRNDTYFRRMLEKVDLHFPIIERIFREENLPDDFKYLVIQESALVADAVSSSQAVGFWQFKEGTALEVGLVVDRNVDERMNLPAATRAAARHLKQLNYFYNNWLYALLAYNTGRGGAERFVDRNLYGARAMEINKNTHWYVKKYLAHKIAFEPEIGRNSSPPLVLTEYREGGGKNLDEIAAEFAIEPARLAEYNKWLRRGRIPGDRPYTVILPLSKSEALALQSGGKEEEKPQPVPAAEKPKVMFTAFGISTSQYDFSESDRYPILRTMRDGSVVVNQLPGAVAAPGDNVQKLADQAGLPVSKFLSYNDMTTQDRIESGKVYYFSRKSNKARMHYHIAQPGESLWDISQKFGLRLKKLMEKNRMKSERELQAGRVLWLRYIRPPNVAVETRDVAVPVKSAPAVVQEQRAVQPSAKGAGLPVNDADAEYFFEEESRSELGSRPHIDQSSFVDTRNGATPVKPGKEQNIATGPSAPSIPGNQAPEDQKNTEIYHTVGAGETLYGISRLYGVPVEQIAFWNNLTTRSPLNVGQRLIVGKPSAYLPENEDISIASSAIYHRVQAGETLYSIAREYNMTVKEIMDLNGKSDFTLRAGEEIRVMKRE
jgi:membrane-bound lytic murein transglycosylase D